MSEKAEGGLSERLENQAEYLDTHRPSSFAMAGTAPLLREAAAALSGGRS